MIYRIAFDKTWYPWQLFDKEDDISIFSKELAQAIATEQHFSIQLLQVESAGLFPGLDNGDYEGVLSSLMSLGEDNESYITSHAYYQLGPVLVVSATSDIESVKDLNGKDIGIISGSRPTIALYKTAAINFIEYDYNDVYKLVDDVANNAIDGMVLGMIPAYEYVSSGLYRGRLKVVSDPLTNDGLRLIAKRDPKSEKLIVRFNEGLKDIKKNGVYSQLLSKWDLFNPEKS